MIKYSDLVQYIKENHVNWNTDLFDVLRGFFNQYSPPTDSPPLPSSSSSISYSPSTFIEPEDGEYLIQDLINLLST